MSGMGRNHENGREIIIRSQWDKSNRKVSLIYPSVTPPQACLICTAIDDFDSLPDQAVNRR
jgi:hypothetical protein